MHVFYLHGFASSAQSSKASFFRERFAEHGVALHVPDFNDPDFSTLTITRMVAQVRRGIDAAGPGPVALIGSSLGGFVAVQSAAENPGSIERLVLLAPALDFSANRVRDLGDRGLEEWRATNTLNVFHYGYGRLVPVHYELFADAQQYHPLNAKVGMPIQIFQGRGDTSVSAETVERWADARRNVELHMLDDDHQLHASLPYIWTELARFLGLK
ncbi:MAG TPA: YqiA/YcfP family alpha/beta fold hydrolase [Vicinamibacterales bacterium]|nr:YqiA/YcfP family alpha/beta fold hydrolase [Vicinamibacterales bacterium]